MSQMPLNPGASEASAILAELDAAVSTQLQHLRCGDFPAAEAAVGHVDELTAKLLACQPLSPGFLGPVEAIKNKHDLVKLAMLQKHQELAEAIRKLHKGSKILHTYKM